MLFVFVAYIFLNFLRLFYQKIGKIDVSRVTCTFILYGF